MGKETFIWYGDLQDIESLGFGAYKDKPFIDVLIASPEYIMSWYERKNIFFQGDLVNFVSEIVKCDSELARINLAEVMFEEYMHDKEENQNTQNINRRITQLKREIETRSQNQRLKKQKKKDEIKKRKNQEKVLTYVENELVKKNDDYEVLWTITYNGNAKKIYELEEEKAHYILDYVVTLEKETLKKRKIFHLVIKTATGRIEIGNANVEKLANVVIKML